MANAFKIINEWKHSTNDERFCLLKVVVPFFSKSFVHKDSFVMFEFLGALGVKPHTYEQIFLDKILPPSLPPRILRVYPHQVFLGNSADNSRSHQQITRCHRPPEEEMKLKRHASGNRVYEQWRSAANELFRAECGLVLSTPL